MAVLEVLLGSLIFPFLGEGHNVPVSTVSLGWEQFYTGEHRREAREAAKNKFFSRATHGVTSCTTEAQLVEKIDSGYDPVKGMEASCRLVRIDLIKFLYHKYLSDSDSGVVSAFTGYLKGSEVACAVAKRGEFDDLIWINEKMLFAKMDKRVRHAAAEGRNLAIFRWCVEVFPWDKTCDVEDLRLLLETAGGFFTKPK